MTMLNQLVIVLIWLNVKVAMPYILSVVGREANDVTWRCSLSGSIVQDPDFWVITFKTDATFRSMLDVGARWSISAGEMPDGELQFSMQ